MLQLQANMYATGRQCAHVVAECALPNELRRLHSQPAMRVVLHGVRHLPCSLQRYCSSSETRSRSRAVARASSHVGSHAHAPEQLRSAPPNSLP